METINKYLETLFSTLPSTPETTRLCEDISAHMEEKYNELKIGGKSENEAIGIIISEFGSIEEIKSEMGLPTLPKPLLTGNILGLEEVRSFFALNKKSCILVAIGVFLCLLGAASLVSLSTLSRSFSQNGLTGVVVLLVFIAVAVGLFIFADSLLEPFSFLEKNRAPFSLTQEARSFTEATGQSSRKTQMIGSISGVSGILLGVIILLLLSSSNRNNSSIVGLLALLVLVGLSVATFIITSATSEACNNCWKKVIILQQAKRGML